MNRLKDTGARISKALEIIEAEPEVPEPLYLVTTRYADDPESNSQDVYTYDQVEENYPLIAALFDPDTEFVNIQLVRDLYEFRLSSVNCDA